MLVLRRVTALDADVVRRLMEENLARAEGAVDLYAIVRDGNPASCAVLQRAGYQLLQELPGRSRWWLPLADGPLVPVME